ncbi:MAG: putative NADPH-flavin oxidoreductase [Promethearchaeota archaeon]|nr:MAG: putative NADPH-flavin oxidoreductase [Candidatus Lokiarchaeota archaeon]
MKNKEFSVNIPSEDMVDVTDYCGITQGKRKDKSILFEAFFGELKNSPLINVAPVNMGIK